MLRKISLIAAIFAALMLPGAAMAKGGHGHGGHGHGHMGHARMGHVHMHAGRGHGNWNRHNNWNHRHNWNHWNGNRHWHGHGRYWHGQWWAYGVGSCWRLVPGGWVWICN